MSKQVTPEDLAAVVTLLLTKPEQAGELDTDGKFKDFMTDVARLVCDHCGGEIAAPAAYLDDVCYVGIIRDESLPTDGGIWKGLDPEGEL